MTEKKPSERSFEYQIRELKESLKAIDEARRANLERAIGAETKCDTLKEQLADARRVDQKTVDNWKQLFDDYRAMKERAEVAEAEVKRWEQAYEELDKSAKVMAEMRHESATDAYNLQEEVKTLTEEVEKRKADVCETLGRKNALQERLAKAEDILAKKCAYCFSKQWCEKDPENNINVCHDKKYKVALKGASE